LEMKESEGMKPVTKRVGRVCHRECSYVEKALLELVSAVSTKVSTLLNCNPSHCFLCAIVSRYYLSLQ
jgi:hypothetical protein